MGVLVRGLPSAGLYVGPLAWLAATQINYALAAALCANGAPVIAAIAGVLACLSLFAGFLSWRAWSNAGAEWAASPQRDSPHRLLSGLGMAMGLLFALVIMLQGAATLVLQACER